MKRALAIILWVYMEGSVGQNVAVSCVRKGTGGNPRESMAMLTQSGRDTTAVLTGMTLKHSTAPVGGVDPMWAYIGDDVDCTLSSTLGGSSEVYDITQQTVVFYTAASQGASSLTTSTQTDGVNITDPTTGATSMLSSSVATRLGGSVFTLQYPCGVVNGAPERVGIDLTLTIRVSYTAAGGGLTVHEENIGPIHTGLHYFYGYPVNLTLECPSDADRSHAWSATAANAAGAITVPHSPVGTLAPTGAMVFCYVNSIGSDGASIIPDPTFGASLDPGSFIITYTESLCSRVGGTCTNTIQEGRAAVGSAAAIPYLSHVFLTGGFRVATQIAFEPIGFSRLSLKVELKGNGLSVAADVNIAGPMSHVAIVCDNNAMLDPNGGAITCSLTPKQQETSSVLTPTAAFTDDFVLSDVSSAVPSSTLGGYVTLSRLTKSAVTSSFKSWNGPEAPGFEFRFDITPVQQVGAFDGVSLSLHVNWDLTTTYYSRNCTGVLEPTSSLAVLDPALTLIYAYSPSPQLTLTCNGELCSRDNHGVLPAVGSTGVYAPLVITPTTSGPGTSTLYFQEATKSFCWTSGNFSYAGTCLTSHANFTAAVGAAGELTLTSGQIALPGEYHFEVEVTYTFTVNHTATEQTAKVNSSVVIVTNHINTVGTTQVPQPVLASPGEVLVYCQDFNDESDVKATVTVQEVTMGAASVVSEATTVDRFEAVGRATGVQLAEIKFLDTSGAEDRQVPTARAVVTQVGADNPLTGGDPGNVFDNDLTTQWVDFNKQKLLITLRTPETFDRFTFVTGLSHPENDITQWTLRGSVDNTHWATLHTQHTNYFVPETRGTQLPWFDLTRWSPTGAGCTGCTIIVISDTTVTQYHDCQWQCEKTSGCTHINWNATGDTSCELLSCLAAPPVVLNHTDVQCDEFASKYRYLEFTPLRTRESPLPIWLFNNDERNDATYKVQCELEDADGATAPATTSSIVTVHPFVRPVLTSEADALVNAYLANLTADMAEGIAGVSVDKVIHYVKLTELIDKAEGNVRVQLASGAAEIIEAKLAYYESTGQLDIYGKRLIAAVTAIATLVNVAVSATDPTLDLSAQSAVNAILVTLLKKVTDPLLGRVLHKGAAISATEAVSILLKGIDKESVLPTTRRGRVLAEQNTLGAQVDILLEVVCSVGDALLTGTPTGTCQNCTECAAHGIHINSCKDTAYNLVDKEVSPKEGTSFGVKSFLNDAGGRVDFNWPLSMVGWTLPSNPRSYDPDVALLKGSVGYFCVKNHSVTPSQRVVIDVQNTALSIEVALEETNTASTPVGIARRVDGAWVTDGCDAATAVASGSGGLTSMCTMVTSGKSTEYAPVPILKYNRCMPGDIPGCVHVVSTDKKFNDCECDRCTSTASTEAPAGYYVEPVASGKYCVPYETFSCSSTGGYDAFLSTQCVGGSFLHQKKCVCPVGSVCTSSLCEGAKQCSDPGSTQQCSAAGLIHDFISLRCNCPSHQYCEDKICLDKVDCSTSRVVSSDVACTNLSRFDGHSSQCVCESTRFCNPDTHTCEWKARCNAPPYLPTAAYCWPATTTQPQLLTTSSLCQCPDNLVCNTTLSACTCPTCLRGYCQYTADTSTWTDIDHKCRCPEGYTGADCSEYEVGRPEFLQYKFVEGVYSGYEGLGEGDLAVFDAAVREVVLEQAVGATEGEEEGGIGFSTANISHVYVSEGSILVRVEVWVFESAWERRLRAALVQDRVAVLITRKLQTTLPSESFEALGDVGGSVIASTVVETCGSTPTLPNCMVAAAPWEGCICLKCNPSFSWVATQCLNNTQCDNIRDCNGRGRADGLVVLGCSCECAQSGFSGLHCEIDDCLASVEAWAKPSCGPVRCAERADGKTTPGALIGECHSSSSSSLSSSSLAAIIVASSVTFLLCVATVFYCVTLRCAWEDPTEPDEEELKLEEDHERGGQSYILPAHGCLEPESAEPTECTVDDVRCGQ